MKKVTLAIALAALVIFAGCKGVTLKASIEQIKGNDRTSLNPANSAINWTAGDKILVNNGTTTVPFVLIEGAGTSEGTFVYIGEYEFGASNVAVYSETATISGNTVSLTLPETQTFDVTNIFGNGINPMLGTFTDSESLVFTSLCGGLGISLTGDNIAITGIEIESWVDTEKLNGPFEADCTAPNPALVATTGNTGTNKVMLSCNTTLTDTVQDFYIVLPVGTLAEGFTMNLYNGGTEPIFTMPSQNSEFMVELNTVKKLNTLEVKIAGGGDEHEYVDLGLPSGLLWATCNVGANRPEDFGDYFAWGEIEIQPKDTYNWSTYKYYGGGNVTKYNRSDGLTTLLPEDDAATVNWGNGWRMPTKVEFQELLNNTAVTWTRQNGVNGHLFTAANGNSLFLPAAGNRWNEEFENISGWGLYRSGSLYTNDPRQACDFYFNIEYYGVGNNDRFWGESVRPVRAN